MHGKASKVHGKAFAVQGYMAKIGNNWDDKRIFAACIDENARQSLCRAPCFPSRHRKTLDAIAGETVPLVGPVRTLRRGPSQSKGSVLCHAPSHGKCSVLCRAPPSAVSSLPCAFWAITRQSDHLSPGASLECSMAPRVIFAVCPHTAKRLWFLCRASQHSKDSYVYFFPPFFHF
jgi:hypothetical protein